MKKTNGKYKNGNSNNFQYSLNYKFDSVSPAGKVSGTALELIKKYNELAKEAHGNGDYAEMENFRQYAEHYRKIVTEINEKKNVVRQPLAEANRDQEIEPATETSAEKTSEQSIAAEAVDEPKEEKKVAKLTLKAPKKFKVVEIEAEKPAVSEETKPTVRRRVVRKKTEAEKTEEAI